MQEYNEYHFFWDGPFSNWYPSKFSKRNLTITESDQHGPLTLNCNEQYMMIAKALTFHDRKSAESILRSDNPREQKKLGRGVIGYNDDTWHAVARRHVYDGAYAKFTQNPDLFEELIKTDGKLLVEASPYDIIWGIGLDEETAKVTPKELWEGRNWLGEVLTKLRENLKNDVHSNPYEI